MLCAMQAKDRLVSAARELVGEAALGDFLAVLTIEGLRNQLRDGDEPPPSSETVTKAFARNPGDKYERRRVFDAVLEQTVADILEVARGNADGYLQAIETVRLGGGPEAFAAALRLDLKDYAPWEIDDSGNHRERFYYLATALADSRSDARRHFAQLNKAGKEIYRGAWEGILALFDRRLATGIEYGQLWLAISAYLEGVQIYRRQGAEILDDVVFDSVVRIFWAHSSPLSGKERIPIEELFAAVRRQP
jgi:hypothetical protein